MHAYTQFVRDALTALDRAIIEARGCLSERIDWEHYIACRHAPDAAAAWEVVLWAWKNREDTREEDVDVLSDLVQLSKAAILLRSTLIEQHPSCPPDLRLPRTRRTA
jgi:hypothetical protein